MFDKRPEVLERFGKRMLVALPTVGEAAYMTLAASLNWSSLFAHLPSVSRHLVPSFDPRVNRVIEVDDHFIL